MSSYFRVRFVQRVLIKHLAAAGCLNLDNAVVKNRRAAPCALVVEHNWDFILPATTAYVAAHIGAIAPVLANLRAGCIPVAELDAPVIQPACFQYVGNFYWRLIVIPRFVE